uniref:Uncharacterized protein n=1 Tax=Panagrolaimus sp. ES5 TaxID=591445 RepID=A0AC34F6R3_9BILA
MKYNPIILPTFVNSGVGEDWVQQIPKRISIIDDKSLVITTSLYANYINQSMLSKFIQEKFFKCEAKHIDIMTQRLTEKEFDFLVGHGNVESCYLAHVPIFKDNGQLMLIEEIMAKMPKLKDFSSSNINITNESMDRLQRISFQNKLLCCKFRGIEAVNVTPATFYDFIVKNAAPYSTFGIYFTPGIADQIVENFRNHMKQMLAAQLNLDHLEPKIIVSNNESSAHLHIV